MDGIWISVSFLRLADRCNRVCGISGQLRFRGERKWSSGFLNTLELFCIELSLEAIVFYDLAVCLVGWLVGCAVVFRQALPATDLPRWRPSLLSHD